MKKNILSIVVVLISTIAVSQNDDIEDLKSFGRVNLGLHGLEFTYELPISSVIVWENSFGAGMGSYVTNAPNYRFDLDTPTPHLTSEFKYMYNRQKRFDKNRSTRNNSGNYIALQAKYSFGNINFFQLNKTLLSELHWGIQRPIGKRFIFDLHIGLGYLLDFDSKEGIATPTFGLRFGYVLFK